MSQRVVNWDGHSQQIWDVERLWELAGPLPVRVVPLTDFSSFFDARVWAGAEGLMGIRASR